MLNLLNINKSKIWPIHLFNALIYIATHSSAHLYDSDQSGFISLALATIM